MNQSKVVIRLEELKKYEKTYSFLDYLKEEILKAKISPFIYLIEPGYYSLEWDNFSDDVDHVSISVNFLENEYEVHFSKKDKDIYYVKEIKKGFLKEEVGRLL